MCYSFSKYPVRFSFETGVEIRKDAKVRFKVPKVTIKSGARADDGSSLSIQ